MEQEKIVVDCFGDVCPLPVLKAENKLKEIGKGESFMLVTDHSCVVQSLQAKASLKKVIVSIDEVMNGVWEIVFKK